MALARSVVLDGFPELCLAHLRAAGDVLLLGPFVELRARGSALVAVRGVTGAAGRAGAASPSRLLREPGTHGGALVVGRLLGQHRKQVLLLLLDVVAQLADQPREPAVEAGSVRVLGDAVMDLLALRWLLLADGRVDEAFLGLGVRDEQLADLAQQGRRVGSLG